MKSLSELKSDFIENNFKLDDDGFVRSVRTHNFNGNGLLQPVSFNDLEDVYKAGVLAGMEIAEIKQIECDDWYAKSIQDYNKILFLEQRISRLRNAIAEIAKEFGTDFADSLIVTAYDALAEDSENNK